MNASYRTLLRATFVAVALVGSTTASAIDDSERDSHVKRLIDDTRNALGRLRQALEVVDAELTQRSTQQGGFGRSGTFGGGMSSFRELEREAEHINSMGNEVRELAAHCGEDGRRVGSDYTGLTRRLLSTVKRIGSASSASSAQMSTSKVLMDANAVEQRLGTLVQLQGCVKETDDKEDDSAREKSGDRALDAIRPQPVSSAAEAFLAEHNPAE